MSLFSKKNVEAVVDEDLELETPDGDPEADDPEDDPVLAPSVEIDYSKLASALREQENQAKEAERIQKEAEDKAKAASDNPDLARMEARCAELMEFGNVDYNPAEAVKLATQIAEIRTAEKFTKLLDERLKPTEGMILTYEQRDALIAAKGGLSEGEQGAMDRYIAEKQINPALLRDATVLDLVQTKAKEIYARESGADKRKAIPHTETTAIEGIANPTAGEKDFANGLNDLVARMKDRQRKDAKPLSIDISDIVKRVS